MDFAWVPSAGHGHVYTWTTVYRSTRPEFVNDVPYTLVVVELDDFPVRIPARLRDVTPGRADLIGAAASVRFDDVTPDVSLIYWVLDE
jgi:uncharacterized OB-fold protein